MHTMSRAVYILTILMLACTGSGSSDGDNDNSGCPLRDMEVIPREDRIPEGAEKVTPATDLYPPVFHASGTWNPPVPLGAPINTAGLEDSPFITADGKYLYFYFTPLSSVSPGEQALDGMSGIYRSQITEDGFEEPVKLTLFSTYSLEGCAFVSGNTIHYCAAVCGTEGLHYYSSTFDGTGWSPGEMDGVLNNPDYGIGEFHMSVDGNEIYYHSSRVGGKGGRDLWMLEKIAGVWTGPFNLECVNTPGDEGYPFLANGDTELWFSGTSRIDDNHNGDPDYFGAVFRCEKSGDCWSEPEEIVSQLAGEPAVDPLGNAYFMHHYYRDGLVIEADIYVLMKK